MAQRRREWKLNRTRAHDAQAHKHTHAESASCYGRRYPDLAYAFCKDGCNVHALHRHFQNHGRREGRRFGCEAAPLTAAETAKWKVHEARLRAKDPTKASVPAEAPRRGPCKRPGDRYVVMLSAYEQMNKNIAVVAMVADCVEIDQYVGCTATPSSRRRVDGVETTRRFGTKRAVKF